jgi:hypothetical protein
LADKERKTEWSSLKTIPKDNIPNNGKTDSIIIAIKITWRGELQDSLAFLWIPMRGFRT